MSTTTPAHVLRDELAAMTSAVFAILRPEEGASATTPPATAAAPAPPLPVAAVPLPVQALPPEALPVPEVAPAPAALTVLGAIPVSLPVPDVAPATAPRASARGGGSLAMLNEIAFLDG